MSSNYNQMSLQEAEAHQMKMTWEPDCIQLTLYQHYQYMQYYR